MSILGWLFKPKKKMAQPNTKWVKMGKYSVSSHAQNRVADPTRDLKKKDMVQNLFGKSQNSNVYTYKDGTRQYDRINKSNKTVTHITNGRHVVKSIRKYHKKNEGKELKKFGGGNHEKNKK